MGRLMSVAAALLLLISVVVVAGMVLFFVAPERVPQFTFWQELPPLPTLAPLAIVQEEALPTLVDELNCRRSRRRLPVRRWPPPGRPYRPR
jgi:hypothetical protein